MQATFALVVEGSFVAAYGRISSVQAACMPVFEGSFVTIFGGILGVQAIFVPVFEGLSVAISGGIPSLQAVCALLLRRGWGRFSFFRKQHRLRRRLFLLFSSSFLVLVLVHCS